MFDLVLGCEFCGLFVGVEGGIVFFDIEEPVDGGIVFCLVEVGLAEKVEHERVAVGVGFVEDSYVKGVFDFDAV